MNEIARIGQPEPPHSVEAEQQVLGALMLDNDLLPRALSAVSVADFYDPVHARIFSHIMDLCDRDAVASPVSVAAIMADDEGLRELGGARYLVRTTSAAITPRHVVSYCELIREAREKRDLIATLDKAKADLGTMRPGDVSASLEASLNRVDAQTSAVRPVSMMQAVTRALGQVMDAQRGAEGVCVRPPLSRINSLVTGFYPGELWLLAGRPSMGKSAVALSVAMDAARRGHPVIFASLEMTPEALAMRALSEQTSLQNTALAYQTMRSGTLSDDQMQNLASASEAISELPFFFLPRDYQAADLLPVGVKQSLRRVETDKLPLVVVDYAQLMRAKGAGRYEQITEISLTLKGMAMHLGLPVIALSQLSRAVEQRDDKRPRLSDLRESGQLEQDADGVMFCYRDEYYLEREEPDVGKEDAHMAWQAAMERSKGKLEVIVAKQRMGQIGTAHIRFAPAMNRIWE